MSGLVTTYQFRLPRGPHEAALDDAADHLCRMERLLHADLARAVRAASVVEDGVAMVDREALREAAYFHRARKAPGRWQFCQHCAVDDAFYFRRA